MILRSKGLEDYFKTMSSGHGRNIASMKFHQYSYLHGMSQHFSMFKGRIDKAPPLVEELQAVHKY